MSYESRRDEQRQYESDVFYEVWWHGGNPDRINDDRVSDRYYNGDTPEDAAMGELRRQHQHGRQEEQEQEQMENDGIEP